MNSTSEQQTYKPYLSNSSNGHIYFSRIRMGHSGLNTYRKKYHFIDHNTCPSCHSRSENEVHLLLKCAKTHLCKISVHGTCTCEVDVKICKIVAEYIKKNNRFAFTP